MSVKSEEGFEQRALTDSEWEEIFELFKSGNGSIGAVAFRRHDCCLRNTDLLDTERSVVGEVAGIQAAMNIKFSVLRWPFKVVFRSNGRVYTPPSSTTFGRYDAVDGRILLLCKK